MRNCSSSESLFTSVNDGEILLKQKRPALVVSSTSWSVLCPVFSLDFSLYMAFVCYFTWAFTFPKVEAPSPLFGSMKALLLNLLLDFLCSIRRKKMQIIWKGIRVLIFSIAFAAFISNFLPPLKAINFLQLLEDVKMERYYLSGHRMKILEFS